MTHDDAHNHEIHEPFHWPDIAAEIDDRQSMEEPREFDPRADAFAKLLCWLLVGRNAFPKGSGRKDYEAFLADALDNPQRVGMRCIALIYAIRPSLIEEMPSKRIAKRLGVSRTAFNKHVLSFVREFPVVKPPRCFGESIKSAVRAAREK